MSQRHIAVIIAAGSFLVAVGVLLFVPPVAQDPAYHAFADQRIWLGVPHAGDVLTNIPFIAVGLWGLWALYGAPRFTSRNRPLPYAIFFAGVALVGPGSAYYHWAPDNASLVWDRLPMSVAFMALFAAFIADRISVAAAKRALGPLVVIGVVAVVYWAFTDDLRPYALVQFLPIVIAVVMCATLPSQGALHGPTLGAVFVLYGLAKILEAVDVTIWNVFAETASGHNLKHLAAAAACAGVVLIVRKENGGSVAAAPTKS